MRALSPISNIQNPISNVQVREAHFERAARSSSSLGHWIFAFFSVVASLAPGAAGELAPPDGDGGLAGLSADDAAALREARGALESLAADEGQPEHLRRDAAAGLNRIHEALNDWGKEGQLDWYLAVLSHPLPGHLQGVLVLGAQSAAKARQPHLGGVHEFWRTMDTLSSATAGSSSRAGQSTVGPADRGTAKAVSISGESENVRRQFHACIDHLAQQSWSSSPLHPFELKIPPIDLRDLKPLAEPKK